MLIMRLLISPVLSILIAVSASIGILDSFRLDGEPQSITPDENNPDHNLFSGGDLSPVAFNNLNPTPDSCIASTGGLQTTGKLWARLDCDHMNLENPEESGSAREYQPVAPDAQGGTGQENGNGKKVNGNGYRNNRPQESDQQGELNSNPLPGGGANNRLPPNLPFRNDPLDECKGYFAVFEYVVCDSGKSTISRAILDDIIGHEHPLLPNMETFTLKHCTQVIPPFNICPWGSDVWCCVEFVWREETSTAFGCMTLSDLREMLYPIPHLLKFCFNELLELKRKI